MPGGTDDGVEAEVAVCDDASAQDDEHVGTGILDGVLGGPEEVEQGVEEEEAHGGDEQGDDDVEGDGVAEHLLCRLVVALAKAYAEHGAGSYTDHGSEGSSKVHEGHGGPQSGDGVGAYASAYEEAVYVVEQRAGRHGNDGWQGVFE